jgi:PAS domain S-box-containing protein
VTPSRPRFRSRASATVIAVIVAVDLLAAWSAWRTVAGARRARYAEALHNSETLARVLGENLEGTLRLLDFALVESKTGIERELARGGVSDAALDPHLARIHSRMPFVDAIRSANRDGAVVHGIGVEHTSPINVADRDYFVRAKAAGDEMIISAPLVSRITKKRSIVFARRLTLPGGGFGGVVWAVVPLDRFADVLAQVKVGRLGAVALRDRDLTLLARFPETHETAPSIGQRAVSPQMSAALQAGLTEGSFVAMSPVLGKESATAFRRVGGEAFLVVVVASPEEFLAEWREQATRTWATTALFALLTALGGWVLLGSTRRESEARFRVLVEEAPIAVALTRGTRIVYVNHEFVRTMGLPSAEVAIGRSILDSVPPEEGARLAERMERRTRGLQVEPSTELVLRRPDGRSLRAAITDAMVEFGGEPAILGFIQDVTAQRTAEAERERLIGELKKALAEVKTLSGLLPICSHCKKVRDDHGYWNRIETFIRERSSAEFTHGICPDCARQFFPDETDDTDPAGRGGTRG